MNLLKRMTVVLCLLVSVWVGWCVGAQAEAVTLAEPGGQGSVLLVNAQNPLPEDYEPEQLVNLYEMKRYFRLASSEICLEEAAFEAMNSMFYQAGLDGVEGFIVTSGYRTQEKQAELYEADKDGTAAAPGESEHQTGLAFDVTARVYWGGFEDTKQFKWLEKNCWDYGFILRYPKGADDITGFSWEPWHYRYVGVEIAQQIRDSGWTLEEYCGVM